MSRALTAAILALFGILSLVTAGADSGLTTLSLGVDGGAVWEESDVRGTTSLSGSAGHRRRLGESQYLEAAGAVRIETADFSELTDRELLAILWGARSGLNLWETRLELSSSLSGPEEEAGYLAPQWSLEYEREVDPWLPGAWYTGVAHVEPDGEEDLLDQSIGVALSYQPTIRTTVRLGLASGWVYWPETPLFDSGGAATASLRNDLVLSANLQFSRLYGYFTAWDAGLFVSSLTSNANRWVGVLERGSEDRMTAGASSSLSWSPRASTDIAFAADASGTWYENRRALDRSGALTPEALWMLSASATASVDWTPDQRIHFILSSGVLRTLSNESDQRETEFEIRTGVDLVMAPRSDR